jgi:AcrR family transcriptional regulator
VEVVVTSGGPATHRRGAAIVRCDLHRPLVKVRDWGNGLHVKAKLNIREAQKALTRQRILDAARELFYRQGYYETSVDQIAAEAGASRPTFYLHFRDKEEVLAQIAAEYTQGTRECAERLPGPKPTLAALRGWLRELSAFLEREKMAFSVMTEISAHHVVEPVYVRWTMDAWRDGLASRSAAFAAAERKDKRGIEARAMAELLILEITWATTRASADATSHFADVALDLVAQHLHTFLHDPRFVDEKPPARLSAARSRT